MAFQDRQQDVAGGPGIGRAFQYNQLSGSQALSNRSRRRLNILEIGVATAGQRSRNANQNDVGLVQSIHIAGGLKSLQLQPVFDRGFLDMGNIAFALVQHFGFFFVDVESDGVETGFDKRID